MPMPDTQQSAANTHRSLLLRVNRALGAALVEHNLVNIEHLEAANERLFELLKEGVSRQTSLLSILTGEMASLNESDIVDFAVREHGLGVIDLRRYNIEEGCRERIEANQTWATWTMPFDKEDEFTFVATAYHLSPAARAHWEELINGPIIWYATTVDILAETVDRVREEAAQGN